MSFGQNVTADAAGLASVNTGLAAADVSLASTNTNLYAR